MLREKSTAPSDASSFLVSTHTPASSFQDGLLREAKQRVFQLPGAQDSRKFAVRLKALGHFTRPDIAFDGATGDHDGVLFLGLWAQ